MTSKTVTDADLSQMIRDYDAAPGAHWKGRKVVDCLTELQTWRAGCTGKHGSQMSCVGSSAVETSPDEGFQARVHDWMAQCFVRPDAMLPAQRSFRFTEEALELAQASGTSREDVMRLVDYVYGRPVGAVDQEIGGVVVTLAGLANSVGLSVEYAGNAELARCVENTDKIRAKDLAKPQRSPLPGSPVEPTVSIESDCSTGVGGVTLVQMAENIKLGLDPYTGSSEKATERTVDGYTCRKCGVWYAGPNGFHECSRESENGL